MRPTYYKKLAWLLCLLGGHSNFAYAEENDDVPCALWLAESAAVDGTWGLYSGIDVRLGEAVGGQDGNIHIPIFDINTNEWNPWHNLFWQADEDTDLLLQNFFRTYSFLPGIGSIAKCDTDMSAGNIVMRLNDELVDSMGVHRGKDPTAGSFSYRENIRFYATQDISAGEEIILSCGSMANFQMENETREEEGQEEDIDEEEEGQEEEEEDEEEVAEGKEEDFPPKMPKTTTRFLQQSYKYAGGPICLDTLVVQKSTNVSGRGAFSKREFEKGDRIIASPVALVHRSEMKITDQYQVHQDDNDDDAHIWGDVKYTDSVLHEQLMKNYVFGHPESNLLILPYGAGGVQYINHASGQKANVAIQWSDWGHDTQIFRMNSLEALKVEHPTLLLEFVALRDITPGEELLLDYGEDWVDAWTRHVEKWQPQPMSEHYISASDYHRSYSSTEKQVFRTVEEQLDDPYPQNIITACFFAARHENEDDHDIVNSGLWGAYWNPENRLCLRPCALLERKTKNGNNFYKVQVSDIANVFVAQQCELPGDLEHVLQIPEQELRLVDRAYTSDQHLSNSFRHEIGVPREGFFPTSWMALDPLPDGDFDSSKLAPGEIEPIRWKSDKKVVTPNSYVVGMSSTVREKLLEYAEQMNIVKILQDLTFRGNSLPPGNDMEITVQGFPWYLQRPKQQWKSNLHWLSPLDKSAQEDFLHALSDSGFDNVLSSLGKYFGFKSLVCYQLTFIAVSQSAKGRMHSDMTETSKDENASNAFNIIIPLLLGNQTGPELDLRSDSDSRIGRLRYQYDVAAMMGDEAYHGTSAVDYNDEMRLMATIYVGDIDNENVDRIMADYTQQYPPSDQPDVLLGMAANPHWSRDNPQARLPKRHSQDMS